MDTKSDEQFLVIEATIESNKKESDKNHKNTDEKLTLIKENQKETYEKITLLLTAMMIDKKTFRNTRQPRRIHRLLQTLPRWS